MSSSPPMSKRRGQYVSRACNECRRRRCKCDGGQPSCGTCVFYGRECSWSAENDARRPATKQLVASLHTKIQMLEAELSQLKRRSTESDQEPSTPLDNNPVFPPDQAEPSTFELELPESPGVQTIATTMYRYIFDIDASASVSDQPKDVHLSLVCQWNRYLPQIPQLTRLEHDTILFRCFKYGVTWLHCMLPETFLHDMLYSLTSEPPIVGNPLRPQHYTPMLHCALLAYASAFSDNPEIRSLHARARFAQYSKQWLDYEFERPVMALTRALALLAEYHCGIGELCAGYMYMGMSIRAVRSLIFRSDEPWTVEDAPVASDFVERDWHFWSAFCQDKLMALEYKQQSELRVPHAGVSLPSIDTVLDNQPWSDGPAGSPLRLITKTFFNTCKLMVISGRIIELLYDKHPSIPDERSVINLHLQLDTWFNNLPQELLVWARTTSPLPHLISLHICYWFLIMCLHRPFYDRSRAMEGDDEGGTSATSEITGQGGGPIHERSIKLVDRATHKIVQLVQMFEDLHSMTFFPRNMIHVIYECGLVLLKEAMFMPFAAAKKRAIALDAVGTCLRALRGISRTWPWAERLANQLEENLNEVRANTTQLFISEWTGVAGENDETEQTLYSPTQVWDPSSTGLGNSSGNNFMHHFSGMQIDPSETMLSPGQLGLELYPHPHDGLGRPSTSGSLGGSGESVNSVGAQAGVRDGRPFAGTSSNSTMHYQ